MRCRFGSAASGDSIEMALFTRSPATSALGNVRHNAAAGLLCLIAKPSKSPLRKDPAEQLVVANGEAIHVELVVIEHDASSSAERLRKLRQVELEPEPELELAPALPLWQRPHPLSGTLGASVPAS